LGWKEGTNVRVDERWGVADTEVIRASAISDAADPSVIVVQILGLADPSADHQSIPIPCHFSGNCFRL
jgi:hypothetical protein